MYFFHISFWCLPWDTNPGFKSNKPTHYLLDYGDLNLLSVDLKQKNEIFKNSWVGLGHWCLTGATNPGFTSNKPTHYLLDYGDFNLLSVDLKQKRNEFFKNSWGGLGHWKLQAWGGRRGCSSSARNMLSHSLDIFVSRHCMSTLMSCRMSNETSFTNFNNKLACIPNTIGPSLQTNFVRNFHAISDRNFQ